MINNSERQKIVLAALLHDIGKFWQRADDKINGEFKYLKEYWNQEGTFCPQYKGIYSRKHVLWTAKFFDENKNIFSKLIEKSYVGENSLERVAGLHHKPETEIQKIIQLADWYASGIDRSSDPVSINDGIKENDFLAFKKKRMVSIFESIEMSENNDGVKEYKYSLPIQSISLKSDFFPKLNRTFNDEPDYESLWKAFIEDFSQINHKDFNLFYPSLLSVLEKHMVNTPGSTLHLPDVSLYDHSKMTAAFALCIYDYAKSKNEAIEINFEKQEAPIILIGADISGIQSFIYNIISKNAAKNLKGRSFYLQLLLESIIQYILKKLNLYRSNVVYSSGGGFFILAPNTEDIKTRLKEIENTISQKLFEKHKTDLFIAFDAIPIQHNILLNKTKDEKEDNSISKVWADLFSLLNKKKRQRYINNFVDNYEIFFNPNTITGKEKRDAITGEELQGEYCKLQGTEEFVNKNTLEQIELGKNLRQFDYWVTSDYDAKDILKKSKGVNPLDLEIYHYFFSKKEKELSLPDFANIKYINNSEFTISYSNSAVSKSLAFYGGNSSPIYTEDTLDDKGYLHKKGRIKTFEHLVGNGELNRLGVLRMDVDNLGQIFINGFDNEHKSFSRYSSLSRSLDYFFKGYINTIHQEKKAFKENISILYSGGDDLFIIGKWDDLIQMAEKIREEFSKLVCYNPSITLSGGISIVGSKFPIMKAAKSAGNEEKNAKDYRNNTFGEKDAFSLMGYALSWKEGGEYQIVKAYKNKFNHLLSKNAIPKSIMSFISNLSEQRRFQINKNKNESWQWMLAYQLSRFKNSFKDKEVIDFIDQIKKDVFSDKYNGAPHQGNYHILELISIAARWAELEQRTNKNN